MNYNDFMEEIKNRIKAMLPEAAHVDIRAVTKNNGTRLDGLMIIEEATNVSPTIYLNGFYDDYLAGRDLEGIISEILKVYQDNALEETIDMTFFVDFERVKDRIVYKLINYDKNQELLEAIPHIRFLDLAIVFYYMVDSEAFTNATILIYKEHIKQWKVSADELYQLATDNTPRLLKGEFRNMLEYLMSVNQEFIPDGLELGDIDPEEIIPMYILSNFAGIYGASCILYKDLLSSFAKHLEANLIILPSSVHEVIIVPDDGTSSPCRYKDMVKEVNEGVVAEEEILSDTVYYYSLESNLIAIYA